jgi:hypothetical protein
MQKSTHSNYRNNVDYQHDYTTIILIKRFNNKNKETMKKELDLTSCNSTEEMCEKIEKELTPSTNNKSKKNKKKQSKNYKQKTTAPVVNTTPCVDELASDAPSADSKPVETVKLTVWQKIKNWFKKVF